jgi:riboflavin kinase/FMN adenylyltransferase
VCLALGMFDGVHLGHRHVLQPALSDAQATGAAAVFLTFDPHPQQVVRPDQAPRLIQSLPQRLRCLGQFAPSAILVVPFDAALSQVSGEAYLRSLAAQFGRLRSLTVGEGFHFGHRRSGNVALLRQLAPELGFAVHAIPPVELDGAPISSTRIRTAVRAGQLGEVARLLGRPYTLAGTVVTGARLGRTLGFPTANLDVTGRELPPLGVYAARLELDGRLRRAVLNLGRRPTVADPTPEPRLEVHIPGFSGDLYGRELEVELLRPLRAEQRFASLDALKEQIARDVADALADGPVTPG